MGPEDTLQSQNLEAPDSDALKGRAELKPQNPVEPMEASSESQFVPELNRVAMEGKCQQNEYANTPSKKTETGSRGYPSHIDTSQDERGSGGDSYRNDAKYSLHSGYATLHRAVGTAIPVHLVSLAGVSAAQPHTPHPTIPMTPEKSAFLSSERLDIHDSGKWHKNIADELGCSDYEADSDPEPVVLVGWDT